MDINELHAQYGIPFNKLPTDIQLIALYMEYKNGQLDAGVPESELLTFAEWKDTRD
jgi:hypothetical protein